MEDVYYWVGIAVYLSLGMVAIWGAFCVIIVWRRVSQTRFRNEAEQDAFLDQVDDSLHRGDFEGAAEVCQQDPRAMSQLALLAVGNRDIGYAKIRKLIADRFQRDVLADLEYRLSWVYTVVKTAPMLGLFGTVIGMMGAFANLASNEQVDTARMAEDISFALVTTASGLAIAIPLVLATASINVRIRKLEDLVASGMSRFLDVFKAALKRMGS